MQPRCRHLQIFSVEVWPLDGHQLTDHDRWWPVIWLIWLPMWNCLNSHSRDITVSVSVWEHVPPPGSLRLRCSFQQLWTASCLGRRKQRSRLRRSSTDGTNSLSFTPLWKSYWSFLRDYIGWGLFCGMFIRPLLFPSHRGREALSAIVSVSVWEEATARSIKPSTQASPLLTKII